VLEVLGLAAEHSLAPTAPGTRAWQYHEEKSSPEGVPHPGSLYECQNKGLTKFAFRKLLILKGAFSVDGSKWEGHRRKEEQHHGFGRSRRKPPHSRKTFT